MAIGAVLYMHGEISWVLILGLVAVLGTMAGWFWEVIKEAEFGGYHNPVVQVGMRYGMALFIASEVMFFVAWFWAYFNAALFPTEQIDGTWPPPGIQTFDTWDLPFLNTLILLMSGITVTWAHHALREGNRTHFLQGLASQSFSASALPAFRLLSIATRHLASAMEFILPLFTWRPVFTVSTCWSGRSF